MICFMASVEISWQCSVDAVIGLRRRFTWVGFQDIEGSVGSLYRHGERD